MIDLTQIDALVATELVTLRATTAAELVDGSPQRRLGHGTFSPLPYSKANAGWVAITLVPDTYKVETELGLRFSFAVDGRGATVVTGRPERADLVAATRLALDGEVRAVEAAAKALDATGARPPGRSWADALRVIRLDPRLPAAQFLGQPSWQLIFDPFVEANGGYHGVILGLPGFTVTSAR